MNIKDLKKLKINERVKWTYLHTDNPIGGTVIERGYSGLRVKWEDGFVSTFFFNHDNDDRLEHLTR